VSFYNSTAAQNTESITAIIERGLTEMGLIVSGREEIARQQIADAVLPTVQLIHAARDYAVQSMRGGKDTPGGQIMQTLLRTRSGTVPSVADNPAVMSTRYVPAILASITETIVTHVLSDYDSETGRRMYLVDPDAAAGTVAVTTIFDRVNSLSLMSEGRPCVVTYAPTSARDSAYYEILDDESEREISRDAYDRILAQFTIEKVYRVRAHEVEEFYELLLSETGIRREALPTNPRRSPTGRTENGDYFVSTKSGHVYCLGAGPERQTGKTYADLHSIGITPEDFEDLANEKPDLIDSDVDVDGPQDSLDLVCEEHYAREKRVKTQQEARSVRGRISNVSPESVSLLDVQDYIPRSRVTSIVLDDPRLAILPCSATSFSQSQSAFRTQVETLLLSALSSDAFSGIDVESFAVEQSLDSV